MRTTVDVAVVGGGVIGCTTAHAVLRDAPDASVVVLERDGLASGATRRSAALHLPRGATERVRRMASHSQDHYARLLAREPAVPIRGLPMTVLASESSAAEVDRTYLDSARLRRVDGVPDPRITVPAGQVVWQGDACQYADAHQLTLHLARTFHPGVSVREGVRVTGLALEDDAVVLSLGNGERVRARRAVLAPGPWAASGPWREHVEPLGIRVKKVVALHLDIRPGDGDHVTVFHDEDAFLLPLHHRGHWLFSYTCREWDVEPDALASDVSADNLREAREVLGRYAPELVGTAVSGRAFCDAYSPSREPVVTPLDPGGGLVFAGACNGAGYRLAPAIAAEAAELVRLPHSAERSPA
ncbi:NAD(P)/FAD-dependent oxidoreductase [Streptomyces profundus]|uniref:NAD(P)/FAD-dependent oxidoreductase n=1 Tax=Streptomyces profundus TaxID=2867410 RepID=UPI001D1646A3|nr:FAD-dependent oxidoreductase [Streptomyces sp. MA3_2.13]UED86555.1 FAD-dependent oxidoreductase [Streptomyces sp. MA3_2.13]